MTIRSAGILPYRFTSSGTLEVFLVHPGGPFWAKKDNESWSLSKGIVESGEDELEAAKREFKEETGKILEGNFTSLGEIKQPSKKIVVAWALHTDIDEKTVISNTFNMEWPKDSGVFRDFPEVDRAEWFNLPTAKIKILKGQVDFVTKLAEILNYQISDEVVIDKKSTDIQGSLF